MLQYLYRDPLFGLDGLGIRTKVRITRSPRCCQIELQSIKFKTWLERYEYRELKNLLRIALVLMGAEINGFFCFFAHLLAWPTSLSVLKYGYRDPTTKSTDSELHAK